MIYLGWKNMLWIHVICLPFQEFNRKCSDRRRMRTLIDSQQLLFITLRSSGAELFVSRALNLDWLTLSKVRPLIQTSNLIRQTLFAWTKSHRNVSDFQAVLNACIIRYNNNLYIRFSEHHEDEDNRRRVVLCIDVMPIVWKLM